MRRLFFFTLLFANAALAQEPRVFVETTPDEVTVGEPLRLRVTVLGPTWFPRAPEWPSFEVANAVVRLPPDSSRSTSQRIDGEMWTGVVRNYEVYPLVAAGFRLDGLTMSVTYADPADRSPVLADIDVPSIQFRATVPPGAAALDPYVAGERLELRRDTDLGERELEAGDAVVVTYTAELDGMPAMFIPPLFRGVPEDGVSVYADTPVVEEGDTAVRRETVTFVFETGGEFLLPGAELDWWNRDTGAVDTALVAPLSVSVTGPVIARSTEAPPPPYRFVLVGIAALLLLLFAYRVLPPWLAARRDRLAARKRDLVASEQWAFGRVLRELKRGEPRQVYAALSRWIERAEPGCDVRNFADRYGDQGLVEQIEYLSKSLYSDGASTIDLRRLERGLVAARMRARKTMTAHDNQTLEPLNP